MINNRVSTAKRTLCACLAVLLLGGCALNRPRTFAYPSRGQDAAQQTADRQECENWARNESGYDAAGNAVAGGAVGAVAGAGIGAAVGAIAGAFIGQAGRGAAIGAALGGTTGAVEGAAGNVVEGRNAFSRAFAACMEAKGYNVK